MTKTSDTIHSNFMRAAFSLARRGLGNTTPNPAVGCILVQPEQHNRVVGRGWTQPGGRPHAETEAIRRAGESAKGSTAYVTLEPCCHDGQTPPCTEALIAAGVKNIYIATTDPDPRVAGQGIAALQQAGLSVQTDLLKTEADALNAGFISRNTQNRPFITLKTATSLDSRIATATGHSQWITGDLARQYGHALRARHDAILTGMGTVRADNPNLTCRLPGLERFSPIRVVLDPRLEISAKSHLISDSDQNETLVLTGSNAQQKATLSAATVIHLPLNADGSLELRSVVTLLAERGINRLLIEAGATLSASFLKAGLVDELVWFRAPVVIGGDGLSALNGVSVEQLDEAPGFRRTSSFSLGPDRVEIYQRRTA